MNFDSILNQIGFFVIFQGFLLGAALWFIKKGEQQLNRLLGVSLLMFSWSGVYYTIDQMGKMGEYKSLAYTNFPSDYIYNPLIFLYVCSLTIKDFRPNKKWLLHFIPAALLIIYYSNYYFSSAAHKQEIFSRGYNYFPYDVAIFSYANLLQLVIYLTLGAIILQRYGKKITGFYSNIERRNYNWLKFILIINMVSAVICFFIYGTHMAIYGKVLSLMGAILVCGIGYKMIDTPPQLPDSNLKEEADEPAMEEAPEPELTRYAKSGLTDDRVKQLAEKLLVLMERDKPWLQPELTLKQTAELMHIPTHQLSQVINQHFKKNFYDFVNNYRVEEVKHRLSQTEYAHLTILAIAFDCGFNSKASFNNVFKKLTGHAPSALRNAEFSQ